VCVGVLVSSTVHSNRTLNSYAQCLTRPFFFRCGSVRVSDFGLSFFCPGWWSVFVARAAACLESLRLTLCGLLAACSFLLFSLDIMYAIGHQLRRRAGSGSSDWGAWRRKEQYHDQQNTLCKLVHLDLSRNLLLGHIIEVANIQSPCTNKLEILNLADIKFTVTHLIRSKARYQNTTDHSTKTTTFKSTNKKEIIVPPYNISL
jgi:hypothetical protein